MSFELRPIYGDAPAELLRMTAAVHREYLHGLVPAGKVCAFAVVAGGKYVGLGLARVAADRVGEVVSLFVSPSYWRQGLGTRLLESMEAALRERGCVAARLGYSTLGKSAAAVERLLTRRGWSAQPQLLLAQIHERILDEAAWMRRSTTPPAPFHLSSWSELAPADRNTMESFRDEVPPALWPLRDDSPPDPHGSLVLRRGVEIAGWIITHRAAPRVIRFGILFVRERWRTSWLSFLLAAEAARRLRTAYGPGYEAALAVQVDNVAMRRVLERKLRPWATLWGEHRVATKRIL